LVEVHPVGAGGEHRVHFLAQAGEIRGQDRGRDDGRLRGGWHGRQCTRWRRLPYTGRPAARREACVATTLLQSDLPGLVLRHRGKVRDVFDLPADASGPRLLIVATDRLSAFDVVLPDALPRNGEMLRQISNFWVARTAPIVPNPLTRTPVADAP